MNIIVGHYDGNGISCRPDTTWERENKDLYSPDCIKAYSFTPVLFARIAKAGKFIGKKYAGRYYDGIGFGLLLYISEKADGRITSIADASCADHTSYLPFPLYNPVVLGHEDNLFRITRNGEEMFSISAGINAGAEGPGNRFGGHPLKEVLEDLICAASQKISFRIGDMIAAELDEIRLFDNHMENTEVQAGFCGNVTLDFKIIR